MTFSSLPDPDELSIGSMQRGFCPDFDVMMAIHIYVMSKFGKHEMCGDPTHVCSKLNAGRFEILTCGINHTSAHSNIVPSYHRPLKCARSLTTQHIIISYVFYVRGFTSGSTLGSIYSK
jgi:hypothetical protein